MGEGPVGTQKATLHDPLGGLSFCAFEPTSGMGLDQKLKWGREAAAEIPKMSQDLPASPGMNAQVCSCSSFPSAS